MEDIISVTPLFSESHSAGPFADLIDAELELGAYETLWTENKASFKSLAEKFKNHTGALPSEFVPEDRARETAARVIGNIRKRIESWFNIKLRGELEYPTALRDATYPVEMLYYQGWWDLIDTKSIAIVGTRKPSEDGLKRTRKLVHQLIEDDFTIMSGLAEGIDTAAHTAAIAEGGRTIAVIGTPLGHNYPKSNVDLQKKIAEKFLLISQIPIERYEAQHPGVNRFFFPERNKTMSALSKATIIVEAGETSGTLIQARAAIQQNRKLFILNSCFENTNLKWPEKYEKLGAIRVRNYDDIRQQLVVGT